MTNPFFNFFDYPPTQFLIEDLILQAISIYGNECLYIPRNLKNFDTLYFTDDQSTYRITIPIDVYVQDQFGFTGMKDIYSKFGLEIRDSIILVIAKKSFDENIKPITGQARPDEGDLIYFTLNNKCFQIKYVNNKELFYPAGVLPVYRMELNLFEYSDETFATGIEAIDSLQQKLSLNARDYSLDLPDGTPLADVANNIIVPASFDLQNIEPEDDNDELSIEGNSVVDFSTNSIFGGISK